MTTEKKEKLKHDECKQHNFIVTGWITKGGHQNASALRCSHCLKPINAEALSSKEWSESQGFQ